MLKAVRSLIMALLLCAVLSACNAVAVAPGLEQLELMEEALRYPRGPQYSFTGIYEGETLQATAIPELTLSRLDLPSSLYPLGMLDANHGYLIDRSDPRVLWLCDYAQDELLPLLDYRGGEVLLGSEIAFSDNWLIWLELDPFNLDRDGINRREVRLMARELDAQRYELDIILDKSLSSMAEGFYLPFDQLGLAGDNLVYRGSLFKSGRRDTQVVWVDLSRMAARVIGQANGDVGRQILHCSISGSLIAWDVQTNFQLEHREIDFPPQPHARYTIYAYQTDASKLPFGASPERLITQNDDFFAPFLYRETLLVLAVFPQRISWTAMPIGPMGGDLFVNHRTYDNAIFQINYEAGNGRLLVGAYDHSADLLQYYINARSPRAIQRDNFYAGQRFLSWQSNVSEHHIVYDLASFNYVELPVYFADAYSDGLELERIYMTEGYVPIPVGRSFTFWPHLQEIRVTPIPGPDADYFYFEHMYGLEEPYILRIRG